MKDDTCVVEEIEMISRVTGMWNPDLGRLIGWVDAHKKHNFKMVHNVGDMWRVTVDDHETMVFPDLFDALIQVAIKITGYVHKDMDVVAVTFNAQSDRDKWKLFWDGLDEADNIDWVCRHCGHIDDSKPQRSEAFHGCSIVCDWCEGELSHRTGGGQGDPFGWIMRMKS